MSVDERVNPAVEEVKNMTAQELRAQIRERRDERLRKRAAVAAQRLKEL